MYVYYVSGYGEDQDVYGWSEYDYDYGYDEKSWGWDYWGDSEEYEWWYDHFCEDYDYCEDHENWGYSDGEIWYDEEYWYDDEYFWYYFYEEWREDYDYGYFSDYNSDEERPMMDFNMTKVETPFMIWHPEMPEPMPIWLMPGMGREPFTWHSDQEGLFAIGDQF